MNFRRRWLLWTIAVVGWGQSGLPPTPLGLDAYMPVPDSNPLTRQKIDLGRQLFSDTRLSRTEKVSCATCHDRKRAFTDGKRVSDGVFGRQGTRSAPAIVNRGYGASHFWDGRAASLEEQVLKPIQDPTEMDLTLEEASARVGLTRQEISQSLASYLRSIRSGNSALDRYMHGDAAALSDEQRRGLSVFRTKANCNACHVGPNFTDERFHNTGVAWREGRLVDEGRFAVSSRAEDRGAFKTPTLREIAATAPYMHDGSLATLEEVVEFYARGANPNPHLDAEIRPLELSEEEKRALVAFLRVLSGEISEGAAPAATAHSDLAAGRTLFAGKGGCPQCHSVENQGGVLGPDLSEIGLVRTPEQLRLALVDPDAEIHSEYFTIAVETRRGQKVEGIRLNEDDFSIQLRDGDDNLRSFQKDQLKTLRRELRSLMPSYASRLSATEINDLVAYLRSLKAPLARPGEAFRRTRAIAPVSERLDWLTRPDRDGDERPETVLDALDIPEGATVADVGAGAGYFTWRLARRVGPKGRVIAVESQQKMLDLVAEELRKRRLANVDLVLGEDRNPRLPEAAVDLVLIANAYHEFSDPEAMMGAIRRSLKPGGRVAVLEYRKEDAYTPVEGLHKMGLREVRFEMESMGFETEQVLPFLPLQHLVIFRSPPP